MVHLFAIGESSINFNYISVQLYITGRYIYFFHMHEFSNQILVSFLLDQIYKSLFLLYKNL